LRLSPETAKVQAEPEAGADCAPADAGRNAGIAAAFNVSRIREVRSLNMNSA
jgi:hypothetical protein